MIAIAPNLCEVSMGLNCADAACLVIEVEDRQRVACEWSAFARICIAPSTYLSQGKVIVFQAIKVQPQAKLAPVRLLGSEGTAQPPRKSFDIDLDEFLAD